MKKRISIFVIFLSIIMIGAGLYLYFGSAKRQMLTLISNQLDLFEKKQKSIEQKKAQYVTNVDVKENDAIVANFSGDIYVDPLKSKSYFKFITKVSEQLASESLNIPEIYVENNKMYFKEGDDLYYIDITEKKDSSKSSKNESELIELKKIIKDTIVSEIPEDNFSKQNEKIKVLNNESDTIKYSVYLTSTDIYNIMDKLLTNIQNSDKVPNIKKYIFNGNTTKKELLENVDLKDIYGKDSKVITYSVYVKDDLIVKHEIILNQNNVDNSENSNLTISYADYEKNGNVHDYEFVIKDTSKKIISVSVLGEENNSKIDAEIPILGLELSGTISNTDKSKSAVFNLYNSMQKANPLLYVNYEYKEISEASEYEANLKISFESKSKYDILMSAKILEGKDVPEFDTSNAKQYSIGNSLLNKYQYNM